MKQRIAVRAGKLIDGLSPTPMVSAVILIEHDRFSFVGDDTSVTVPEDAMVIDASDFVVLPGLIDAHVHIHTPGGRVENYVRAQINRAPGELALEACSYAQRSLRMGFTTLRSLSSPLYIDVALRNAIDRGLVEGPRLRVAGQGLSATGGHMDQPWWSPDLVLPGRTGVCDGPWECRKAARTQIKWGADVIKINSCAGSYADPDRPWKQEMTYEEIKMICEEAHWAGKRVAAHTSGGRGITDSICAGVDTLEHAHWLTDEQIALMVERGTFYVPTLIVNSRIVKKGAAQAETTSERWRWLERAYEAKWDSLRRAKDAGVKIAVGTDAGFVVSHGENASELAQLVKGGFTPMEAIFAATRMGAECLGMENEIGTIEPGKLADLVIIDGNPLDNIGLLLEKSKIRGVVKGGQTIVWRT